ncbi:MAG: ion transporter [Methanothrix sp.]|uniref:ion transporter n=1 Tax=Methanothrix sp. TaxID=90426 RepID=UPI0025F1AAA1|nr:ion transporter [Methanothrix sp.]MCQ8903735.1 ion transporter [Methanothrix sp.]
MSEKPDKCPGNRSLRETIQFYMIDFQTPLGRAIDIAIIALNIMVVALFVIETYPLPPSVSLMLWRLEVAIIFIFVIEYLLRFYGAPDRWSYIKDTYSMIDLVAIMPTLILLVLPLFGVYADLRFIQTIRIITVFRIFRFLRFIAEDHLLFGIISLKMLNVARLVATVIIIFFIYSGLFYFAESPVNPDVNNFGDAFYFTVIAVATVGFGDIVPVSGAGRLVTLMMIISGIILIPIQVSRIFREWISAPRKRYTCSGCGQEWHEEDARYCRMCGSPLEESAVSQETDQ